MSTVLHRAKQTVSVGGTGDLTLGTASTNFQTLFAALESFHGVGNALNKRFLGWTVDAAAFDCGIFYLSASDTVVRETIYNSTNGGVAINATTNAVVFSDETAFSVVQSAPGVADASTAGHGVQSAHISTLVTNATVTGGRLHIIPFQMPVGRRIQSVLIRPTTINSTKVRIAEYRIGNDGFAKEKLWETGDITPVAAIIETAIPSRFWSPGWHYLGFQCDVTDTFNGFNAVQTNPCGTTDGGLLSETATYHEFNSTTWPMPDPAGTPTWKRAGAKVNIRVRTV
jgi:hypothetical protein